MIFCESASSRKEAIDDVIVFTRQLNAAGVPARVRIDLASAGLGRNTLYDIAPFAAEDFDPAADHLVLTGAQELDDETMIRLRRLTQDKRPQTTVFGSFRTQQTKIGIRAKLSYALGHDPEIIDLTETGHPLGARCPDISAATASTLIRSPRPRLMLLGIDASKPGTIEAVAAMKRVAGVEPVVVTNGNGKAQWAKHAGTEIPAYHYGELGPDTLAGLAEIAAVFMPPPKNHRMRALIGNLAARGVVLLDCTPDQAHSRETDSFIASTPDMAFLSQHLTGQIIPQLEAASDETRDGTLVSSRPVPARLVAARAKRMKPEQVAKRSTLFMPTNGVGLGHAQRCSLIASEMDQKKHKPVFAAFGSCMRLLRNYGFDTMPLVSRAEFHAQSHQNDLLNYARLRRLASEAGAFVFDGGYVFDSIYRTITELGVPGVWVRRGLWQAGQDNSVALDREKIFSRVIVPTEAFDELNQTLSQGDHLRPVGPIVQELSLDSTRESELRQLLADQVGRPFDRLVVTMLGGGVAADRSAQSIAVAAECERHAGVLNLVVVWPTATVEPGLFDWQNTRVFKTHHASALVAAADLFVSAVGYNSFHEALYNQVPSIFIPQMAKFMDDQAARAEAAAEREVATVVAPENIFQLQQEIAAHLTGKSEDIRTRLTELTLPDPGNIAAARIIEELQV